jgi:pimeloyl-ACP methyl ester carboxylesterase
MKRGYSFLYCGAFLFVLVICGCTNEPDNVATSSDGVKIVFDRLGKGEPTLVFIHGWSNNKSIWDAQMSHFSQKHTVIAIDLAGFGQSGNNRNNWTIESFCGDVVAVINRLSLEHVVLVGFSMGGPVAIETAKRLPERAVGVVLVDALHNPEMKYSPEAVSYMDSVFMDLVSNPTNEKLVGGGFYRKNPERSYERILSMLKVASRVGWRESLRDTFRWQNESCIESLTKIQAPITAINSSRGPTNVEAFRKYVPSFKAKFIPEVGHVVMWDAPEEFNRLLEESIREFTGASQSE